MKARAWLLRESFRQDGKVHNRTLTNLSHWPPEQIEALRQVLKGDYRGLPALESAFEITRSLPHGHVATVLATLRHLHLETILDPEPSRDRDHALALIAARILEPASKLATFRSLRPETCHHSLGEELQLGALEEDDLYAATDWLMARQASVEAVLALRHLRSGTLLLYDLFLAMLAYYVEWHMRQALAPVLFDGEPRGGERPSVVAPAVRSPEARAKARTKRTADNWPVQSFQDWLKDLGTIVQNRIQPRLRSLPAFEVTTRPTASQRYALELLGVRL